MGQLIDMQTKEVLTKPRARTGQCYELHNGCVWCPAKQWYLSEKCPFSCRAECDNFQRMTGAR